MASSWRSLLKLKIHSVLSRDKEIKEQFLGRWQEIEKKVSHADACEVTRKTTTCRLTKACQVVDSEKI